MHNKSGDAKIWRNKKMVDIKEVRRAVELLSQLSDSEWEMIEKSFLKESESSEESVEDTKKEISEEVLEQKITSALKLIGIPAHIKGYGYARQSILLLLKEEVLYLSSVTKALYPEVARIYKTTSSRVERAIRHAIELAWERGNIDIQEKIFGYTISSEMGKPTNSEFLAGMADYIKMYML